VNKQLTPIIATPFYQIATATDEGYEMTIWRNYWLNTFPVAYVPIPVGAQTNRFSPLQKMSVDVRGLVVVVGDQRGFGLKHYGLPVSGDAGVKPALFFPLQARRANAYSRGFVALDIVNKDIPNTVRVIVNQV